MDHGSYSVTPNLFRLIKVSAALHLGFVDFAVNRRSVHQFIMRSDVDNGTVIHDNNSIGIHDRGNALRDDQLCGVGNILTECLADFCIGGSIAGTGGIVENQDLG